MADVFRRKSAGRSTGNYIAPVWQGGQWVYRSTRTADLRAARNLQREWQRLAHDPTSAAAHSATLGDALDALIALKREEAKAGRCAEATVGYYAGKAGVLKDVLEYDGDDHVPAALASLQPPHGAAAVDGYVSQRREDGATDSTIHKELQVLRMTLQLAKRHNKYQGDLDAVFPLQFSPDYVPRTRWLPPVELDELLGELTADRAAQVAFSIATSAERSALDRARDEDLTDKPGFVHVRGTKNAKRDRWVPIVAPWQLELLEYVQRHARGQGGMLFLPWSKRCRDLLAAGDRVTETRRAKDVDAPEFARCSPNDLRRTCATWLRADGMPLQLIAEVLGHTDTKMVERVYGRMNPETLRELMQRALGQRPENGDRSTNAVREMPQVTHMTLVTPENLRKNMGREGIEPSTLGLKVRSRIWTAPREGSENTARMRLRASDSAAAAVQVQYGLVRK